MKVITFYTKGTPYENEIEGFKASVDAFHLSYHIEGLENQGTWAKNCQLKPRFIRSMLEKFQEPLFWVDIDARFIRYPALLVAWDADFAVRFNEHVPPGHRCHILSGSIYCQPTEATFTLLETWERLCSRGGRQWDQTLLAKSLPNFTGKLSPLPAGYAWIHSEPPQQKEEVVVVHYQASNFYKKRLSLAPSELSPIDAREVQLMARLGVTDIDASALASLTDFLSLIKVVE